MILHKFPMPPTSNRVTMPFKGRLIKSPEYRMYEQKVNIYKLRNLRQLDLIHDTFKDSFIHIDTTFVFAEKRIFTKDKSLKVLDSSNRIKICHDVLSKLINIDDKYFVSGCFSKAYCENEKDEQVIIKLGFAPKIYNLNEID